MNQFAAIQHGLLPSGTVTDLGMIADITDTAYKMADGSFVAFTKVHGPYGFTEPLVVFG